MKIFHDWIRWLNPTICIQQFIFWSPFFNVFKAHYHIVWTNDLLNGEQTGAEEEYPEWDTGMEPEYLGVQVDLIFPAESGSDHVSE